MKKVIYSTFCAVGAIALATSCSDFLETSSPSKTDAAFVFSTSETARAALEGAYAAWVDAAQNKVFGDGLFYAADVAGSDIERHPEKFEAQPGRHYPECFYQNGKYAGEYALLSYQKENDTYASLYSVINKANIVVLATQESEGFQVDCYLEGMGEIPEIQDIYIDHIRFSLHHAPVDIMKKKQDYAAGKE